MARFRILLMHDEFSVKPGWEQRIIKPAQISCNERHDQLARHIFAGVKLKGWEARCFQNHQQRTETSLENPFQ